MYRSEQKPVALVVDDSESDRVILARYMEGQGFQVDKAADGIAAERMLSNRKYDVLVSDLRMPKKHGHQLIAETLQKKDAPLIIAITGLAEPKLVADLISRGVLDVVQKPVSYDLLAVKIRALFDRATQQRKEAAQPGGRGGGGAPDLTGHIQSATQNLRTELARVTETFKDTIEKLEQQKTALEADYKDFMRLVADLLHSGGNSGSSHAGRVEEMANAISRTLKLHPRERQIIASAALMHDIGQFGMPDELRTKAPWQMSDAELEKFVHYPVIGAALLSEVKGAEAVAEIVEHHAENYDGTGFPRKLIEDDIPLGARIIRLADGIDNYFRFTKTERSEESAREHLHREQGKSYDPRVVQAALLVLRDLFGDEHARNLLTKSVMELQPGEVLAENVYDIRGHFLAREGVRITPNMLLRLKQLIPNTTVRIYAVPPKREDLSEDLLNSAAMAFRHGQDAH